MEDMQESGYLNSFQSGVEIDSGSLLEGLTDYFSRYEVPVGMIHKLFALRSYRLVFIVDDSGGCAAIDLAAVMPRHQSNGPMHMQAP